MTMHNETDSLNIRLAEVYAEIQEAAKKHDLPSIRHLSITAGDIEDVKAQYAAVQQRIAKLGNEKIDKTAPLTQHTLSASRELAVEVTAGMRRQNLLTL